VAERTVLHIGVMKSATTYLQGACEANADTLQDAGLLWIRSRLSFQAMNDLLIPGPPTGDWRELRTSVRAHSGAALVSNELLSIRGPAAARKVVRRLGTPVDVVITARDLARVIPSQWATGQANGRTTPWEEFIAALMADEQDHHAVRWFWRRQDIPRIVDRWGPLAESVTLVTVPPRGAAPEVIAERFAVALGQVPTLFARPSSRPPTSRVRPELTASQHAWACDRSAGIVDALKDRGVRVVGSLDDLLSSRQRGSSRPS
jgi:hypothetical protein